MSPLQRIAHRLGKVAIHDQHLGPTVLEAESDRRAIEARVDRVEDAADHRHAVVDFEQGRHVGRHDRDRVTRAHAGFGQRRGELPATSIQLLVGDAPIVVDVPILYDAGI